MNYKKWIDTNCSSLEGKTVVVTGATGGIGFALLEQLDYLGANVIMAIRNKSKAIKLLENVNLKKEPKIMALDLETYDSIDSFIKELNNENINVDYFVNNAGIYNLKSRVSKHNHEIHMQVNTFSTLYLTNQIKNLYPHCKIISVNSVSSFFSKIDEENIEKYKSNSGINQYGATKLLSLLYTINKKDNNDILIHPGIVHTTMLLGSWPKLLKVICDPICNVLFMNSHKASLNILYAMNNNVNYNNMVMPRGLLSCWGYPKERPLPKRLLKIDLQKISEKINAQIASTTK